MSILILDLGPLKDSYPRRDKYSDIPSKAARQLYHHHWRPCGRHMWENMGTTLTIYPAMGLAVLESDIPDPAPILQAISLSWRTPATIREAKLATSDDWRDTVAEILAERTLRQYELLASRIQWRTRQSGATGAGSMPSRRHCLPLGKHETFA